MKTKTFFTAILLLICTNIAFAQTLIDGIYYNLDTDNKTAEVTRREYTGDVVIPSSVTYDDVTYSVTSIGAWAFYDCSGLTSITIPNSVTSIESCAFGYLYDDYKSFNSVHITDIAAWCSIDFGEFCEMGGESNPLVYAHNLYLNNELVENLTIPNGVTSISDQAFYCCKSLTSVTIPNSVTSIGYRAFGNCSELTSVTIPNSVTSIGGAAFFNCSGLTSVTIPNSVISIGGSAFSSCSGLTSVTIGNSVTSIGGFAFGNCSELTSVTIPNSVTSIGDWAFAYCSGLTSVTIPNSVTIIHISTFMGCSSLISITIPNSVICIRDSAFNGCRSLTSIILPNSVTSISSSAFEGCSSLPVIDGLRYADTYLVEAVDKEITTAKIADGTKWIRYGTFAGCTELTSVTIPNSVTSIGEWAFSGCSSLPVIDGLRYADTYLVEAVDREITTAKIADGTKWIGYGAFGGCSRLTSVTIPNSVTSIGEWAFSGCSGITSVTIPESVTSIGSDAFYGCSSLPVIDGLRYADTYLVEAVDKKITTAKIADGTKWIGDYAFEYCSELTSITIPNSVTSIGNRAFFDCSGLTSVTIGESVTSIGERTFYGCKLTDIVLPSSLETIDEVAFASNAIKTITCYSQRPPLVYSDYYGRYWGLTDDVIIYVLADYLNTYKAHDFWGKYDVRPIEATTTPTDDIQVTSDENTANIIWPAVDGAATYYLIITNQQGNVICTLVFNANGQLTQIAFGAPRRQAVDQTSAEGFSFIVTGLQNGTTYQFTLDALDEEGNIIDHREGEFTTTDTATGLDGCSTINPQASIQKVLINGKVFIIKNGHTYNLQGATVK